MASIRSSEAAGRLQLSEMGLAILEEKARGRPQAMVGADDVGLAGGAESLPAPVAVARRDPVDLVDRQLRDQNTDDDALVDHRRAMKAVGAPSEGA